MMYYSPLRYPGGKRKLANFVKSVCKVNHIDGHYVEPYAGGAGVGLELLLTDTIKEITINDLDRSIYAFWESVVKHPQELCSMIRRARVNVKTWDRAHKIQMDKQHADILELGFSTFFLNRTNYSGIIKGGILGGREQQGVNLIDCRFNKQELIARIMAIAERRKHIHVRNDDAVELISTMPEKDDENTLYYFDPPYYAKGVWLYMNHYDDADHKRLADAIQKIKRARWIVSYDDVNNIRRNYSRYRDHTYTLYHTAKSSRRGREIMFFSDNLAMLDDMIMKVPHSNWKRRKLHD